MDRFLEVLYDLTFGQIFVDLDPTYKPYLEAILFLLVALLLGLTVRRVVVIRLGELTERTANVVDDVFLEVLRRKTVLWTVLLAGIFSIPTLPWDQEYRNFATQALSALFVLSITMSLVSGFKDFLTRYGEKTGTGAAGTTLIRYIGSFIFWGVGIAVILSLFDISLLPALTALGVGGLAVALAFQDTLANLFAGIHITLSRQMRIEDYVEISGGEKGFVNDIGWRTTTLRTLANNLVIIPNKKLAESTVINYNLPEQSMAVEIILSVAYETDPEWLEGVLIDETLKAAEEIEGLMAEPPGVRFAEFGESGLTIKVFPQVQRIEQTFVARHELMKRLNVRLKKEGVKIPYPIRTLKIENGSIPGTGGTNS